MCIGEKVNVIVPFRGNANKKIEGLNHIQTITYRVELEDVFKPPLGHKPSLMTVEDPCKLKELSKENPNILAYIMRPEDHKSPTTKFGRDKITERLVFEYVSTKFTKWKDAHFVEIAEITPKCLKELDLADQPADAFPLIKVSGI